MELWFGWLPEEMAWRLAWMAAEATLGRINLGNGDGTFGATGDGDLDLLLTGGQTATGAALYVVPGRGDGTFDPAIAIAEAIPGVAGVTVDVADVNNDALPDLLFVVDGLQGGTARLYRGAGGGAFEAPVLFGMGSGAADGRLEDLDGDGLMDMVLAGSPGIGIKRGLGHGSFGSTQLVHFQSVNGRLGLADLDGDGELDIVANHGALAAEVFLKGDGAGGFAESSRLTGMPVGEDPILADFDQDGDLDVGRARAEPATVFEWISNHTYGPDEPWTDVGFASSENESGLPRRPVMWAEGGLAEGTTATVSVARNGVTSSVSWLVLGLSTLLAPFESGTLVPSPDVLIGPFVSGPDAVLELSGTVPAGVPPGLQFWLHTWFVPAGVAIDYAATSAIAAVTP